MLACQQTTDRSNLVQTLKSFSVKCYHRIELKSSIVLLLQNRRMNIYVETFGTLFQDCATNFCTKYTCIERYLEHITYNDNVLNVL